jgi:hypothetical protein
MGIRRLFVLACGFFHGGIFLGSNHRYALLGIGDDFERLLLCADSIPASRPRGGTMLRAATECFTESVLMLLLLGKLARRFALIPVLGG